MNTAHGAQLSRTLSGLLPVQHVPTVAIDLDDPPREIPEGLVIDHNNDPTDDRIENLQAITQTEKRMHGQADNPATLS